MLKSPWADVKIKTKNAKNGVTLTVNLALLKDLVLKTPKREVRLEWGKWKKLDMESHYEGSHIVFLESRTQSMSLYRFVLAFLPFIVDLTFGKILNIYMIRVTVGKSLARNTNSLAHVQKIPFLQMPRWVPFKKYRANDLEETCNHPNL